MPNQGLELPEYDIAWNVLIGRAVVGFIESHPLLGKIRRRSSQHRGPTRNVRTPAPLDMPPQRLQVSAKMQKADLRQGNIDAHTYFVTELAEQQVSAMAKLLYRTIDAVSDAAGTSVSANGEPASWDLVLDMIEQTSASFDDDGNAEPGWISGHPDTFSRLPPITSAQKQRFADIMERKEAEHAASKRTRRLPR